LFWPVVSTYDKNDLSAGAEFWIQNDLRKASCPSISWLSYDADSVNCATGAKVDISQVASAQKNKWTVKAIYKPASNCHYFTIKTAAPTGSCMATK